MNNSEAIAANEIELSPNDVLGPRKPAKDRIEEALSRFLADIRNIRQAATVVIPHAAKWVVDEYSARRKKLAKYENSRQEGNVEYKAVGASQAALMMDLIRSYEELEGNRIPQIVTQSLFTQIFCDFDAFVGALLKAIYLKKDSLLKGVERQISISQLMDFKDLSEVKHHLLLQEIDSFRRDSYIEQFDVLEKKFSIQLKKFDEWSDFVEISQRRNLATHNGRVVSEQYLIVCRREGVQFDKEPGIGDYLEIDPKYLGRALFIVEKVAFMLAHTLWRKIFPSERALADEAANLSLYDFLSVRRWKAAADFGRFCMSDSMIKGVSDVDLRVRAINTAIGLKFSGKSDQAKLLLDKIDLTASHRDFKLAKAVLLEQYSEAADLMKSIGKNGEMVNELAYHQWPLFHDFRAREEFLAAFKEVYGSEFSLAKIASIEAGAPPSVDLSNEAVAPKPRPRTAKKVTNVPQKNSTKKKGSPNSHKSHQQ